MADKHMKKYLTSLVTKDMQNKATVRCHFTLTRMAIFFSLRENKCLQKYGEIRTLIRC